MRGLYIPFLLLFVILILSVVFGAPATSDADPDATNSPLPLTAKHETAILAAPDGTVYLVDIASQKILWSFSSGSSIYSSYQEMPTHEGERLNSTVDGDNFYIDCGEDWELYLHETGLKKVKLRLSPEEFVKRTPFVSSGGGVMLGSKKTAVFLVDAKTGKVVSTYRSDGFPSVNEEHGVDEASDIARTDIDEWIPSNSLDTEEVIEKPLYVTRTDYALKYTSVKTGKVLWYLMFADIEASYQCEGIESFLGGFPQENSFRKGQRLDMNLPMHCQNRPLVYRVRDRSSLEKLFASDRSVDALPGAEILSLPAPYHNALVPIDKLIASHNGNGRELVALPSYESTQLIISSPPGSASPPMISHAGAESLHNSGFWPFLYSTLVPIVMTLFFYIRHAVSRRQKNMGKHSEDVKLQKKTPKKKKSRQSVASKLTVGADKKFNDIPRDDADISLDRMDNSDVTTRFSYGDQEDDLTDGFMLKSSDVASPSVRKIRKLSLTDKEIAKGSNGTIVLEGNYDGRSVAVKRLVRSHQDVAIEEIRNLIASDQHPNIVRYYGVENDRDFYYLSLERCTCNLHELITVCTSQKHRTDGNQGHDSPDSSEHNMQLVGKLGNDADLELWRDNGYPSPCLLKLMRDIVRGVAHLHEIGIVHRDLKPSNVLVIKDRSIAAKISDMGISKQLTGDKSVLTKLGNGSGTSGWQAPEQLRNERQTRAVDLFSLGCILFFCITGGKHPFGDDFERDLNIINDRKDLFLIDNMPEAMDLISRLLDPNPDSRPKADEVLNHPLFWDSETRLSFLRDVSDRVELEDRLDSSELLDALEAKGRVALGVKWDDKMDSAFIKDIGRYRRYKYDSVRDLLRVIRNKLNHYRELPKEIQAILGSLPEGFDSYFSSRFPKLLIEVSRVVLDHCADEEIFQKYFRATPF